MSTMISTTNLKKWSSTFGCFLMLLPYGQTFFWGNLYIYCMSYMTVHAGMDPSDQAPWLMSLKIISTGLGGLLCGFLVKVMPKRFLLFLGIVSTSASHFLTYYAVQKSTLYLTLTFGVLMGVADGFIFIAGIQVVVDWADTNLGVYMGVVRSGMYLSAVFVNMFVTMYINPNNKVPNEQHRSILYFSQPDILERVPEIFLILGSFFSAFQLLGFVLVRIRTNGLEEPKLSVTNTSDSRYGICKKHIHNLLSRSGKKNNTSTGSSRQGRDISISSPKTIPSQLTPKPSSPFSSPSSSTFIPIPAPSSGDNYSQELNDVSPRHMIVTARFYMLAFSFLTITITYITINNYYKEFGQLWISDDFFLTKIGTFIPIATIAFSIAWGGLMDKCGIQNFLVVLNTCLSLLGCFYSFSPSVSVWLFSVCTAIYAGMVNPLYSVYNAATAKLFGKTHFAANQAIVNASNSISCLVWPPIVQFIITNLGWNYLFLFPALANFFGIIAIVMTNYKH